MPGAPVVAIVPAFAPTVSSKHVRRLSFERLDERTPLAADTFFVAPGGNDTHPGTSSQPWATLQHAADLVDAGDVVNVLPGTYRGFDLRASGTASARIVFRAQPGVVINQVNPVTNDGINVEQASYVTIEGFTLNSPDSTTRAGIRVVGDGFDQANQFSQHVSVRDNVLRNWGTWGIFTGFSHDLRIENNTASGSVREHGIYVSNSGDRPVIRGNHIYDNRSNGIHLNGDIETGNLALPGVDGVISEALIEGNIIHGNGAGGGSGINGDGLVNARIINNLLYDNHASGISLYQIDGGAASTGGVIANNTIINASDARWVINLRNGATGAKIFNNILFNLNSSTVRGTITALEGSEAGLVSDYNLIDGRFSLVDGATAVNLTAWRTQTGNDQHSSILTSQSLTDLFRNYVAKDFRLQSGSPAIDQGTSSVGGIQAPNLDLLGLSRPSGSQYDIGAYELQVNASGAHLVGRRADGQWWVARSHGNSFISEVWGQWSTAVEWKDVLTADVNGDQREDIVGRANGQWWVAKNTGQSFQNELWGQWAPNVTWQDVQIADVDGNGQDDIVGRTNGQWWIARSNGASFSNEAWGRWSTSSTWSDVLVADVDGNGLDDLVGRTSGRWWVAKSVGNAFVNELWGQWSNSVTWNDVRVADVDGNGQDDIVGRANGQWWVARSVGLNFVNQAWARWSNAVVWSQVVVGDFNHDGRDDLAGRTGNQWWLSESQGTSFATIAWGEWPNVNQWSGARVGDFNGDGRDDLAGLANGQWWVSESIHSSLLTSVWGAWTADTSWRDLHVL